MVHGGAFLNRLNTPALARRLLLGVDAAYLQTYLLTGRGAYFRSPPSPAVRRSLDVTTDLLGAMAGFCQDHQTPLIVVSIPQLFQALVRARGVEEEGLDVDLVDEELAPVARDLGVTWIPLLDALAGATARGIQTYHRVDGHFTAAGNHVAAEALADSIAPVLARIPTRSATTRRR
jgi:hypothetical protein